MNIEKCFIGNGCLQRLVLVAALLISAVWFACPRVRVRRLLVEVACDDARQQSRVLSRWFVLVLGLMMRLRCMTFVGVLCGISEGV